MASVLQVNMHAAEMSECTITVQPHRLRSDDTTAPVRSNYCKEHGGTSDTHTQDCDKAGLLLARKVDLQYPSIVETDIVVTKQGRF